MTIRNPRRRRIARDLFRSLAVMSAFMLALSVWTTVSATRSPAGAATSSGSVSITPTSGSSATTFGLTFGSTPQCAGDSASGGYNWSAIMIPAAADINAVTMSATGPNQVSGEYRTALLASPNGDTIAMQNTGIAGGAGQPGIISGIPQFTFEFNLPGEIPAGSYQVGVVCTKDGGQTLDTYYVTGMTVTADAAGGPAEITWAEATLGGGGTTTTTVDGSTTTTVDGSTTTTVGGSTTTTTGVVVKVGPPLVLSADTVVAGGAVDVTGTEWEPGSDVEVALDGSGDPVSLGTLTADADGKISGPLTIPGNSEPGLHTIAALGINGSGELMASGAKLTVEAATQVTYGGTPSAASPVSTAGQLPFTGSSPIPMVAWAVALLLFGRMAMLMGKRPKVIGDGPAE